jgi:hypothetical protein
MQNEMKDFFMKELIKLTKEAQNNNHTVESVNKRVSTLTTRIEQLESNPPKHDGTKDEVDTFDDADHPEDTVYFPDGMVDHKISSENRARRILAFNARGMKDKGSRHNYGNDDPYAKVKFTICTFYGRYDAEEYLDWEMTVEQKFASHLVPHRHKVRQATREFKDCAIIWWQECASLNIQPTTWDALKIAMHDRFVPASYKRDLGKKLQCLEQGDMSLQDYYAELQKGMIRCGVVEDPEDKVCRFYGGLRREIQDIVDYKTFTSTNQLFELAILVEKELQGRRRSSSTPTTFTPSVARSLATYPSTPPAATTPASEVSKVSNVQAQQNKTQPTSAKSSSSKSAHIVCHRCKGWAISARTVQVLVLSSLHRMEMAM